MPTIIPILTVAVVMEPSNEQMVWCRRRFKSQLKNVVRNNNFRDKKH
jgi:hypothetical protein